LIGRIVFRLPAQFNDQVQIDKNLHVNGTGVFVGNLTAPNILYNVKAGKNVSIGGDRQVPTISVELPPLVTSFQGQTGAITLTPGTDIQISGSTISDISTLDSVVGRGSCASCITDAAVSDTLTLGPGSQINGSAITSGIVTTGVGGTGLTSYNTGDILYASAPNT